MRPFAWTRDYIMLCVGVRYQVRLGRVGRAADVLPKTDLAVASALSELCRAWNAELAVIGCSLKSSYGSGDTSTARNEQ